MKIVLIYVLCLLMNARKHKKKQVFQPVTLQSHFVSPYPENPVGKASFHSNIGPGAPIAAEVIQPLSVIPAQPAIVQPVCNIRLNPFYGHCASLTNCQLCSSSIHCGWCSSTQTCLPGNQSACGCDLVCNTSNWMYHNCEVLTVVTPSINGHFTNVITPPRVMAVARPLQIQPTVQVIQTHTHNPILQRPASFPVPTPLAYMA